MMSQSVIISYNNNNNNVYFFTLITQMRGHTLNEKSIISDACTQFFLYKVNSNQQAITSTELGC